MVIEGIDALAAFIAEMGLPTTFAELGADSSDETLRAVADTAVLMPTCTTLLTRDYLFYILCEARSKESAARRRFRTRISAPKTP